MDENEQTANTGNTPIDSGNGETVAPVETSTEVAATEPETVETQSTPEVPEIPSVQETPEVADVAQPEVPEIATHPSTGTMRDYRIQ